MPELYPEIEPYAVHRLAVGDGHELHVEECGTPNGLPVVFLHGGPGGGITPAYRRFFDPERYRVVLFDQRGCGQSTPFASVEHNTTWDLVADIERIREHLRIEQWLVFGGSWGSTLALVYAEEHPDRVRGLVLRGIFLLREWELDWLYQKGASRIFPDAWESFLAPIPAEERGDLRAAYARRLFGDDPGAAQAAAEAWSRWELATSYLIPRDDEESDEWLLAFARIESHYFMNGGFLDAEHQILARIDRIADIPMTIVQGRYDVVCPMESAWELHRKCPRSRLVVVPDAGHSSLEPGISAALVAATDAFAR